MLSSARSYLFISLQSNSGSFNAPLHSIPAALERLRAHRRSSSAVAQGRGTIMLAGRHYLARTVDITPHDSHITFRSAPGGKAEVSS